MLINNMCHLFIEYKPQRVFLDHIDYDQFYRSFFVLYSEIAW